MINSEVIPVSQVGGYTIGQSLRFDGDDNPNLVRTPSVSGNRKTWTFSGWIKRTNFTTDSFLSSYDGANQFWVTFINDNLYIRGYNGTSYTYDVYTVQKFRDTSAWYHLVIAFDTTQATASDRIKVYINGTQAEMDGLSSYPSQNHEGLFNSTTEMQLNSFTGASEWAYGYLAETHFIDGQALTPDNFGEFDATYGHWKPIAYEGTYGTNGFYLPFKQDYTVEGFSTTLYDGTGANQYVGGVGFSPDLLWIKDRSAIANHPIVNSIGGSLATLFTDLTNAEDDTNLNRVKSFENDGFTIGSAGAVNTSSNNYVAWSWDMGDTTVENTNGTITSNVRANPAYGQSIVSYTGNSTVGATVGHGLSQSPELIITKVRNLSQNWTVTTDTTGSEIRLNLDTTGASATDYKNILGNNTTYSFDTLGATHSSLNGAYNYIAYAFHSVAGYSKIGSYTGTGTTNSITVGFKPAWILMKRAVGGTSNWMLFDVVRGGTTANNQPLYPNGSFAEVESATYSLDITDTGFDIPNGDTEWNASGSTYIYMAFADTREFAFWLDDSGNNNDFTINNLTESDIVLDSPTNNYATLNPLWNSERATAVLSEGNLEAYWNSALNTVAIATIKLTGGKWYWEVNQTVTSGTSAMEIGVFNANSFTFSTRAGMYTYYGYTGEKDLSGTYSAYGATYTTGDIIGVAFDSDTGSLEFFKNGISQGVATTGLSGEFFPIIMRGGGNDHYTVANFGQDSSFAGNKVAQGNTDANGYGDFYYAPPTGYLALCTANLPEPTVIPSEHFDAVAYIGNASIQTINTDIVGTVALSWLKYRGGADGHGLFDVVRGASNYLSSDTTTNELVGSGVTSFNDGSVDIGSNGNWNGSSRSYISWNWKAGGTPTTDNIAGAGNVPTAGSVKIDGVDMTTALAGTIAATRLSANTLAGFSIVSYTPTAWTDTVGHGLNNQIELYIVKNRGTGAWTSQALINGVWKYGYLNETTSFLNAATPNANTSTIVATESSGDCIAYCFHSVEGYSKIGSYVGNGSADGTMVTCGFTPRYIMVKGSSYGSNWNTYDTVRKEWNVTGTVLRPNLSDAEFSTTGGTYDLDLDIVSNGFKFRQGGAAHDTNQTSQTYVYYAVAETPFKYSNGR